MSDFAFRQLILARSMTVADAAQKYGCPPAHGYDVADQVAVRREINSAAYQRSCDTTEEH